MRIIPIVIVLLIVTESYAELIQVPARRNAGSGVLGDLRSRTLPGYGYEGESVRSGHYGTHGTNSRIRNEHGNNIAAGYILKGNAFILRETPFTLRGVYNNATKRGPSAKTYLTGMSVTYWNNQPLTHLTDETTSYMNGALAGVESRSIHDAQWSLRCAMELFSYIVDIRRMCTTASYSTAGLDEFIDVVGTRLAIIYNHFKEMGWAQDGMALYEFALSN